MENTQTVDDAEAILNAIITLTLRGNLNAINHHQDLIMNTWTKLREAREVAGRPEKKIL